jgi:hypothetical protein
MTLQQKYNFTFSKASAFKEKMRQNNFEQPEVETSQEVYQIAKELIKFMNKRVNWKYDLVRFHFNRNGNKFLGLLRNNYNWEKIQTTDGFKFLISQLYSLKIV